MSETSYILRVHSLEAMVHLGCGEVERKSPQKVIFDLELLFSKRPQACDSDELKDSVCYNDIAQIVLEKTSKTEFKLIEYMGEVVHSALKKFLEQNVLLNLKLHKPCPPVDWNSTGTSFEIKEF